MRRPPLRRACPLKAARSCLTRALERLAMMLSRTGIALDLTPELRLPESFRGSVSRSLRGRFGSCVRAGRHCARLRFGPYLAMAREDACPQELMLHAETLRIHPDEPEAASIDRVVGALNAGQVVALPTDTFYGLAVDPVNLRAVDRIYELKTRARHKPLSLLIAEVHQAYELAPTIDGAFDKLAERFWPGPLTIIVKAGAKLPLRVTANTGNVALRVPEAPIARAVVSKLGLPITGDVRESRGAGRVHVCKLRAGAAGGQDSADRGRRPDGADAGDDDCGPLGRRQLVDDFAGKAPFRRMRLR